MIGHVPKHLESQKVLILSAEIKYDAFQVVQFGGVQLQNH